MNSFSSQGKLSDSPSESSKHPALVKVFTIGNDFMEKCSPIVTSKEMKLPLKGNSLEKRKRIPWTKEEDEKLISLVKTTNPLNADVKEKSINFTKIAESLGSGRTSKQCRDRWNNFLRSGIKKGDWTSEEVELIRDMYSTFGPKWSAMAKLFKDRTDNDIKNKWYAMKRKEERDKSKAFQKPLECNPFVADLTSDISGPPLSPDSADVPSLQQS